MGDLSSHMRKGSSLFMPSIIGLFAILTISATENVWAGLLVKDAFEGTAISSGWGTPVISGATSPYGSIEITNKGAYSGTSSVQFNWLALNTSSIYLPKSLPNLNEFYLRFAVKWSHGFQFAPGTTAAKKIWRTFGSNSASADDIIMTARKSGTVASGLRFSLSVAQQYHYGLPPNLDENVGDPTVIETGKWYCFDWHVVGGLGTGRIEGWINGIKKWDYYNVYATSSPMILFHLGGNISPDRPTIDQIEWFDNVALSTAPIATSDMAACGASAAVPPAPTGLVVHSTP